RLDVDYVLKDGDVIIVDEFTGRLMPGRRWSDGLHQAIEAKEGVNIESENQTLATITFQNYFRMYNKLAGMTGTADTEAAEFAKIYGLDVMVIPTHRPMVRADYPDMIYKNEQGKFNAIVDEILVLNEKVQPVLVGTISIETSELLSKTLKKKGIKHSVLNAKHHDKEAEIIMQAGRSGAVTIATNMAGRGTDIVLGGNPIGLVPGLLSGKVDPTDADKKEALLKAESICAEDREVVLEAGGLFILGTERHESRRIDNQLRGRSGRQGDVGASRFYLSLGDDLMRIFGSERISGLMDRLGVEVDDYQVSLLLELPDNLVGDVERRSRRVHEGDSAEVDYRPSHALLLDHRPAPAGVRVQVVGGAYHAIVRFQEVVHATAPVDVVAGRDHVHSGFQQRAGSGFGDPDSPGEVLAVYDDQVGRVLLTQARQHVEESLAPRLADDVAAEEHALGRHRDLYT
ncbi:hypothetical protein LCGC14_2563430, partial [marine sediment metagenome]